MLDCGVIRFQCNFTVVTTVVNDNEVVYQIQVFKQISQGCLMTPKDIFSFDMMAAISNSQSDTFNVKTYIS
ncbi:hypothetical protein BCM02_11021 [Paenibacillus methanolicus]|uniref:Uncharacterized protein n=1 Tax=Paenibacillus methanolicus TaxID=582686 RepID=A0A5S5BY06_9BACL|nr:hypothetical protein BCM02_11021 [Paenibacillus methanolicus]